MDMRRHHKESDTILVIMRERIVFEQQFEAGEELKASRHLDYLTRNFGRRFEMHRIDRNFFERMLDAANDPVSGKNSFLL